MTLRVMAKHRGDDVDRKELARLLGCESDRANVRHWTLHAPDQEPADLDSQVEWIFSRLTDDTKTWKKITEDYKVDLFCGLFLERQNRGVTLTAKTMAEIGGLGIELGLDIYAPEGGSPVSHRSAKSQPKPTKKPKNAHASQ